MAVKLEVTAVGIANPNGKYTVSWTVDYAEDMPSEIFVHLYASRKYEHVASAADLHWPTASTPSHAYFRKSTAEEEYPDIATAETAKTNVQAAIQALVAEYKAGLVTFTTPEKALYS